MTWHLYRSDKLGKKYYVEHDGDRIYFGATGYEDFTTHRDKIRRDNYDRRHKTKEHWRNPNTAGFWAKWILWNLPTIRGSVANTQKRFRIKIINHTGAQQDYS